MKLLTFAGLLLGIATHVSAQGIVEAGAITGATAAAGASAGKAAGKGITNVFSSVEKTLKIAQSAPATPAAVSTPQKPAEPVKLPDVAQISTGMSREDLLAKFGSPSQKMTIPEGSHLTERFRYDVDKETVRVLLEDGKVKEVIAIHPAPGPKGP